MILSSSIVFVRGDSNFHTVSADAHRGLKRGYIPTVCMVGGLVFFGAINMHGNIIPSLQNILDTSSKFNHSVRHTAGADHGKYCWQKIEIGDFEAVRRGLHL